MPRLPVLLKADKPLPAGHATGVERPAPTPVAVILAANHDRFLRFLERRVGRRDLAEEILQDAFVRGLARADSVQASESAIAWFYRLLRNALVDHHRHQDSERRALQAVAAAPVTPGTQPDEELMNTVCACVADMLVTLKPEYAQAIRSVDMNGESVGAFAGEAGITPGNAAVRIHRARQALRRRIEESCGTCSVHACLDCDCQAEVPDPRLGA
jgi:RNA polymerase sigma factor (sigma-70 family)